MRQPSIVGKIKTGSITRAEARAAALAVKAARAKRGGSRNGHSAAITPAMLERFLGHFGTGRAKPGAKKFASARTASAGKRSAAKVRFVRKKAAKSRSSARKAS